jgi:hypothetical protein
MIRRGLPRWRCWSLRFLLLAVAATAVAGLAAAATFHRSDKPHMVVARGVVDGSFHPIAGGFVADGTKIADCHADMRCFEQGFGNLAYHAGPGAALAQFDRLRATDKTVAVDCHRIAHMIGSASLARFHGNVAVAFSRGSASCASGYYHGILERAFAHVHSERGLIKAARKLCRGAGVRRRSFLDYQCTHGLGHGLMIQSGFDVPLSLSICARLVTRWDDVTCTGGVFMENGSTVYGMRSRWLKDDDPLYPCGVVKIRDRASCYLRVTTQMLRVNGYDWAKAAHTCRALNRRWRTFCFRSYGRDAVEHTGEGAQAILRLCRLVGSARGQCLYAAARTIANRQARTDGATALCRLAPSRERPSCFAGLGVVVGLLQPTDAARARACAALSDTEAEATACRKAANAEVAPNGRQAWG